MKVTRSCPTLCDPLDYTVHGILQARMVALPFSRGSPQPRDWTQVSRIANRLFTRREAHIFKLLCKRGTVRHLKYIMLLVCRVCVCHWRGTGTVSYAEVELCPCRACRLLGEIDGGWPRRPCMLYCEVVLLLWRLQKLTFILSIASQHMQVTVLPAGNIAMNIYVMYLLG